MPLIFYLTNKTKINNINYIYIKKTLQNYIKTENEENLTIEKKPIK